MANFREIAELFDQTGGGARIATGEALGELWAAWLTDPAAAQKVGERGRALVAGNSGALDRTLELLGPLIEHALAAADPIRPRTP
jgi:3-deoxy-D-manno-octulosonic-acid transferase